MNKQEMDTIYMTAWISREKVVEPVYLASI